MNLSGGNRHHRQQQPGFPLSSVSLLTVVRAPFHLTQNSLVRAFSNFKVSTSNASPSCALPGSPGCLGTEQMPPLRSHHCQAFGGTKQKSSHECFLPEETVLSILQIDRPERGLTAQPSAEPSCFREGRSLVYRGWGTIGDDVYVNDCHCVGRLRPNFQYPGPQRTGNPNDPWFIDRSTGMTGAV